MDGRKVAAIWITAGIALSIIVIIVAIGTFATYKTVDKNVKEISRILTNTTQELSKVNKELENLHKLDQNINDINIIIQNIEKIIGQNKQKLEEIEKIKEDMKNITIIINTLQSKYPPNQNVYFNNISQDQIDYAVNQSFINLLEKVETKVNAVHYNFYWTLFNSLFSFTMFGLAFYFFRYK